MDKAKRTKPLIWVIIVLLAVNLCATCGVIIYLFKNNQSTSEQTTRYTLYIGLNDKDTYTQLISLDDAKEIVNNICIKYVDGYTVTEADGGWVDDTSTLTQETTLIYSFTGVEESTVISIMDEVLEQLNQNCILVEISDMTSFYYYGN